MKYLKKFNESKSDEFYIKTNGAVTELKDFSESNFNIIKGRLKSNIKCDFIKGLKDWFDHIKLADANFIIKIFEADDEWFFVDVTYISIHGHNTQYYKCDQMDGLLKLLENLHTINLKQEQLDVVEITDESLKELKSILVPKGWFWTLRKVSNFKYWYKTDTSEWTLNSIYLTVGKKSGYVGDIFQLQDGTFAIFNLATREYPYLCKDIKEVVDTLENMSK
jgi:hypothetical protein